MTRYILKNGVGKEKKKQENILYFKNAITYKSVGVY